MPSVDFLLASTESSFIWFAASALLVASFLTSLATTANPRPAAPALVASIAALRLRIFVWDAIFSMIM
jgi:hypothetical protein